ncbi:MAG TPA: lysophospholipid acyltransferase family protein [Flavilitoribacter sp.]|nr:lysophospholipid acyltransferase family protein [Flavilitoribacter sp.]
MLSGLNRWLLKALGWQMEIGEWPFPPKYIVIVVPHTSNWDFPLGLMVRSALDVDIKYVGKESLFRGPLGRIFRWLGGYPVDRSKNTNFVDLVADIFNRHETFAIAIAPEGTRSKVDKLKTGFYYIARAAGVPIIMCRFDWSRKKVAFSKPFYTTDDADADFEAIYDFFRGAIGKIPENSFLLET